MNITQLDIASFGSFSGLNWKKNLRDGGNNVQDFKRLHILYGRNYSGKTARNMASLRKITLNLARLAQSQQPKKVSLKNIRKREFKRT